MNEPVSHSFAVTDMERMARAFATSKLFGIQTPDQALALCLIAQAEGRHPASAANDYHIINGRPSKKAEAMLRDFLSSGGKVKWHALDDTQADATFTHPQGGEVRIMWDMERKKQAGINNPQWAKYPRQMLRSRCVSEGVRTVCPAATSGMYEPEEAREAYGAAEPVQLRDVTPEPAKRQRKAEALPAPESDLGTSEPDAPTTEDSMELIGLDLGDADDIEAVRQLERRRLMLKRTQPQLDGAELESLRQAIGKKAASMKEAA